MISLCASPWQGWKRFSFLIGRVNLTKPLAPSSNHKSKSCVLVRDTNPVCSPPLSPSLSARPGARRREMMAGLIHAYNTHGTRAPGLQCAWGCAVPFGNEAPATHAGCIHCRHYTSPLPVFLHLTTPEWPWPLQEGYRGGPDNYFSFIT